MQKLQRKVEGDLKLTQEAVCDLERVKEDMVATQQRKDKEAACVAAKIEDEKTLGFKYTKQVKELQCRGEELDEELIIERGNRAKAEKNRTVLSRDIQDLGGRLEEAGSNTSTQIELNKKREVGEELRWFHLIHPLLFFRLNFSNLRVISMRPSKSFVFDLQNTDNYQVLCVY